MSWGRFLTYRTGHEIVYLGMKLSFIFHYILYVYHCSFIRRQSRETYIITHCMHNCMPNYAYANFVDTYTQLRIANFLRQTVGEFKRRFGLNSWRCWSEGWSEIPQWLCARVACKWDWRFWTRVARFYKTQYTKTGENAKLPIHALAMGGHGFGMFISFFGAWRPRRNLGIISELTIL
jgi:hypothetical protein